MKLWLLLSAVALLTACDGSKSNQGNLFTNTGNNTSMPQSASGVIGKWSLTNAPKKNMSVELTFNDNGTFRMFSKKDKYDPNTRVKDISGNWTLKGDNIYVSTPGESEVGVMEILSLDANSLVIHIQGEPEKEIMYFTRQR